MKDKLNEPVKPIEGERKEINKPLSKYCHTFNSEECDCGKYCNYEKEYGELEPDPEPRILLAEEFDDLLVFAHDNKWNYDSIQRRWYTFDFEETMKAYWKTTTELLDIFRSGKEETNEVD